MNNQFTNRTDLNANKKKLQVVNIEKDDDGEIMFLEVEEIRDINLESTANGTPLNAENLNSIITSMIQNGNSSNNNQPANPVEPEELTDLECVQLDAAAISIQSKAVSSFFLPHEGSNGSKITWRVASGDAIRVYLASATVTVGNTNSIVELVATVNKNDAVVERTFFVTVLTNDYGVDPSTIDITWIEKDNEMNSLVESVSSNNNVKLYARVVNEYSSYINVTILQNSSENIVYKVEELPYIVVDTAMGTEARNFVYRIDFYLDSEKNVKIGAHVGHLEYIFTSKGPLD